MKALPKWARGIQKVMTWYSLLFVGSLIVALSEVEHLQDVKRVLLEQRLGVAAIVGGILVFVLMWIVVQTARWSARSGRNWEYWIIVTSHVAAACVAPLTYMLGIHGVEANETQRAVGVLGVALTFLVATLVCLIYTLNRYYQEGKSSFFR